MTVPKVISNAVHGKPLGKALADASGDRIRLRLKGHIAKQKRLPSVGHCPYPEGQDRVWWIEGFDCESLSDVYAAPPPPKDWDGAKGIVDPLKMAELFTGKWRCIRSDCAVAPGPDCKWCEQVPEPAPGDPPKFGEFNVLPECPKCHEQNQDWWDGLTIQVQDGTEWPATCGNCGTDYTVVAMVNTLFATKVDP